MLLGHLPLLDELDVELPDAGVLRDGQRAQGASRMVTVIVRVIVRVIHIYIYIYIVRVIVIVRRECCVMGSERRAPQVSGG